MSEENSPAKQKLINLIAELDGLKNNLPPLKELGLTLDQLRKGEGFEILWNRFPPSPDPILAIEDLCWLLESYGLSKEEVNKVVFG